MFSENDTHLGHVEGAYRGQKATDELVSASVAGFSALHHTLHTDSKLNTSALGSDSEVHPPRSHQRRHRGESQRRWQWLGYDLLTSTEMNDPHIVLDIVIVLEPTQQQQPIPTTASNTAATTTSTTASSMIHLHPCFLASVDVRPASRSGM